MESAALQFPWRQLGELLVAEELLTEDELEQALGEQAASGRLLGQILVANGYLSAFSLARVLSEQHGVQLAAKEGVPESPAPVAAAPEQAWRPLGKVLVDLRNVYDRDDAAEAGLAYSGVGRGRLGPA